MKEADIFNFLFDKSNESNDNKGIVTACLVRDGSVILYGTSNNKGIHAEYDLIQKAINQNFIPNEKDILYVTVIPCGKRTAGGSGEKYGDCTKNIINFGIKNIIYAATDDDASNDVRERFSHSGVLCKQTILKQAIKKSKEIFNNSVSNIEDKI